MKVCLLAQVENWRGGIQQFSQNYAEALVGKAEIEIVGYSKYFPLWLYPGEKSNITEQHRSWKTDVPVHNILKYYSPLSMWKAFRLIKKRIKPDVLDIQWVTTFHAPILIPLMLLVKRFTPVSVVLTIHNVLPHEKRFFDKPLCRIVYRLADRHVVHTTGLKQDLIEIFKIDPEKISIVPHGICLELPRTVSRTQARERLGLKAEHVLLFFGLVRKYKGLEYLLESFQKVMDDYDVALVIAGDFIEDKARYEKLFDELAIREKTHVHARYIKDEEVPVFFAAADIVVQPYVHFKGQSGVVPTAFYYSIPVIATSVGGLPEIVLDGRTGLLVEPENSDAIVDALHLLLSHPVKARELGENGRRFLEDELSWDNIVDEMLDAYKLTFPQQI